MSDSQKNAVLFLMLIQVSLQAAALISIARRSSFEIKGRKIWWILLSLVNYVGPMGYLLFGRTRPGIRKAFL